MPCGVHYHAPPPRPSQAFQRLIYISQVVFGDQKAAFLLPWRRTFNLNDAQIFVSGSS